MRAMIHVGMPKTGTTSIQTAFHGLRTPAAEYLDWPGPNHFALLQLLYDEEGDGRIFLPARAGGVDRIAERRALARSRFEAQAARVAATGGLLIVSSEALWAPDRAHLLAGLIDDLRRRGADIEAVAYLRSPLSYATSLFQQRLRHFDLSPTFNLRPVWPRFRPAVESLDRLLGPEAVRLRPFDRGTLEGGDVVSDFAALVGATPPNPPASHGNASLSLEATAVLYAARLRGPAPRLLSRDQAREAQGLVDGLRTLGTGRLAFAEAAWARPAAEFRDDLAWIEDRLGRSLAERPSAGAVLIGCEDDLLRIAARFEDAPEARRFAKGLETLAAA